MSAEILGSQMAASESKYKEDMKEKPLPAASSMNM